MDTNPQRIDRFIQRLEAGPKEPGPDGLLPPEDQIALEIARQLGSLDLSAQSQARPQIRRQLAAKIQQQPAAGAFSFHQMRLTLGTSVIVVLAFFLGWTFSNVLRPQIRPLDAANVAAPHTVYAGTHAAMTPRAQGDFPRPVPTPIAPPLGVASTRTQDGPATLHPHSTTVSP